MEEIFFNNKKFISYITNKEIKAFINRLSNELNQKYRNKKILFIGVLNGCIPFMDDLICCLNINYDVDYVKLSSYTGQKRGKIVFEKENKIKDFKLYDEIIIIEDIIDSGSTIIFLKNYFKDIKSKLKIVSLLVKNNTDSLCEWYGFKIENKFVIGYGMDINNLFRDLKDIYIEKDEEKK